MVAFNQDPAEINPNEYLKYSKPITQPEADKSAGIAFTGIGNAIEEGVSLADSTVKSVIKSDAYSRIDPIRDNFNTTLASVSAEVNNKSTSGQPELVPEGDTPSAPSGVTRGIGRIAQIQAGADGGKATETQYFKDLNTVAKDLRTQYPGYRDYVDQEISKITGVNPANAMISSQLADINRAVTKNQSEQEKWQTFIKAHSDVAGDKNYPGASAMFDAYTAGKVGPSAIMKWANYFDSQKADLQKVVLIYQALDASNKIGGDAATKAGTALIQKEATDAFATTRLVQGESPTDTPVQIADTVRGIASGQIPYPGQAEMQKLQTHFAQQEADYINRAHTQLNTIRNHNTGRTLYQDMGPDVANKMIQDTGDAMFGATRRMFASKEFGLAEMGQRLVLAATTDTAMKVNGSSIGEVNNVMKELQKNPDISSHITTDIMSNKQFLGNLTNFVQTTLAKGATQAGGPQSLSNDIDTTRRVAKTVNGKEGSEVGVAINSYADMYKIITDHKTSETSKLKAAEYLFSANNTGVIQKIAPESVDAQGNPTKGQVDLLEKLSNEKLTKSMRELGNKHPEVWDKYVKLTMGEFGTKMITDVENLKNLSDKNSIYGSQWHFAYDNTEKDNPKFMVLDAQGAPLPKNQQNWLNPAFRTIENLNRGLSNMTKIAMAGGENIDAFLFRTLDAAGYKPNKPIQGVPSQLMQAIILANGGERDWRIDDTLPKPPVSK